MKFVKGMFVGSLISAGVLMMYVESPNFNKKKVLKKGKQLAKKMGII